MRSLVLTFVLILVILYLLRKVRGKRLTISDNQMKIVANSSGVLITAPFNGIVIPTMASLKPYADAAGFTQYGAQAPILYYYPNGKDNGKGRFAWNLAKEIPTYQYSFFCPDNPGWFLNLQALEGDKVVWESKSKVERKYDPTNTYRIEVVYRIGMEIAVTSVDVSILNTQWSTGDS